MKLITVNCARGPEHEDTEPRFAVVVATTGKAAEALCEAVYRKDGYTRFDARDLIEGQFAGPARVIGYAEHTPSFSWAKS
jgi:hypothetical protein